MGLGKSMGWHDIFVGVQFILEKYFSLTESFASI